MDVFDALRASPLKIPASYQRIGLTDGLGFLTEAGRWLCLEPKHGLWRAGEKKQRENRSPLAVMTHLWKVIRSEELLEMLGWLVIKSWWYEPDPLNGRILAPTVSAVTGASRWYFTLSQEHYNWLRKPRSTPVLKILQLGGIIRHTRFTEFRHSLDVNEEPSGDVTLRLALRRVGVPA